MHPVKKMDLAMTSYDDHPLLNRNVITTRSAEQAAELNVLFEDAGAKVHVFPMIATIAPASWNELDAAIAARSAYDWLLFTSANAVKFFYRRLTETTTPEESSLTRLQVGAIGSSTAEALAGFGRKADLVAADAKAEGLVQALIDHLGGAAALREVRFLIPRSRIARDLLPEKLVRLGAVVKTVEAYQTIRPKVDVQSLLALLESGVIDVITFTSSSTVHNFIATVGEAQAHKLLRDIQIACIGPVTADTARHYNLTNIIQPMRFTATALVDAIIRVFRP